MIAFLQIVLASPWARTSALIALCSAFAFWKGFAIEHAQIAKIKALHQIELKQTIAQRDDYWQQVLDKAKRDQEHEMQQAIEAGNAIIAKSNGGRDDLIKLCRTAESAPDCRESYILLHGVQGVQTPPVQH